MIALYIFLWILTGFVSYGFLLYRELMMDGVLEFTVDDIGKVLIASILGPILTIIVVCVVIADIFEKHGKKVLYRRER
jgi:hypothetical protein